MLPNGSPNIPVTSCTSRTRMWLMQQPSVPTDNRIWISLDNFQQDEKVSPLDPPKYPDMSKLWPDWHRLASCVGQPNDSIFFGEPQNGVYQPSGIKAAKAMCNSCAVFEECLRYALENRETWGIWASTTNRERVLIFDGMDAGHFSLEEIIRDRLEARDEQR